MQAMAFPGADLDGHQLAIGVPRSADCASLLDFAKTQSPPLIVDEAHWRKLIAAEALVCARTTTGSIAGYYVTDHLAHIDPANGNELRAIFNVFCNRFKLEEQTVAFGAAAVVDASFETSTLRLHMLRALLRTVGLRYRHLFTFVNKSDQFEMNMLSSEGWRCFFEEDDICYMALNVSRTLRQLPSRLMFGVQRATEASLTRAIQTQAS